jgi:hypothetical protein
MTALLLFLCIWTAILGGVQAQPGERCLCGMQLMHCDALAATTDCSSRLQQAHEPHHQLVQLTMAASLGQKQVADDKLYQSIRLYVSQRDIRFAAMQKPDALPCSREHMTPWLRACCS